MTMPHGDVIKNVEAMERGPHIGAFFDFDGTLIAGFSPGLRARTAAQGAT